MLEKEWSKIILFALPILVLGLLSGGESQLAVYLMGLYMVILFCVSVFINRDGVMKKNIFLLPLTIFTAASFVVTLFSPALLSSMEGFLEYFAYFVFFVALLLIKPDKKLLLLVIFIFCLTELAICFSQIGSARVDGTYGYANFFVFPLVFGLIYSLEIKKNILKFSLILLFSVFLILTGSRIVLVFILVLPFFIVKRKIFALFAPLLLGLILLIPNPIKKRITGKIQTYSLQRPNIWKQAIKTGLDRPVTGWGLRSFEKASLKYNFPVDGNYERKAKIAHNQFLQYFAEGGSLFLLAYLFIFVFFFINFKKLDKTARILILVVFIHSLLDNILYLPANFLIFIILLYIAGKSEENYKTVFSLPVKFVFVLLPVIYLVPLSAYFAVKKAEKEFKEQKYINAMRYFSIAESLWSLPRYSTYLATVNEQMFYETGFVSYLSFAFYLHSKAEKSNPIDWEGHFKKYKFFKRHKKTIQNEDANETAELFLLKAIELNPKNKMLYETLREDYKERGMKKELKKIQQKIDSIFAPQ
jgi:O-antigen ligase